MTRQTPGQQTSALVTDTIDAAVDGLCACGCGRQLDPDGPSGWFASERCQARFHAHRVGVEPEQPSRLASARESVDLVQALAYGMWLELPGAQGPRLPKPLPRWRRALRWCVTVLARTRPSRRTT